MKLDTDCGLGGDGCPIYILKIGLWFARFDQWVAGKLIVGDDGKLFLVFFWVFLGIVGLGEQKLTDRWTR